ncbi:DNA-binding SARP family transcriptional activator [Rudaeicoccus suwonensis]|uniref:DNA-binding SARP family transcriptional activator n=1 Tax=Rudaeicoccus suwonensis TaxID=657409 RepID=A0A561E9M7_9MICO|nr:DNA-binding SARP family transcriptional activator [Rudaeicoccus suwonensis]
MSVDGVQLPVSAAKQRVILAALLLEPGRPVSSARLIDAVWGEQAPDGAGDTLRAYVMRLRKVLGPLASRLRTQAPGYVLDADPAQIDIDQVKTLIEQAHSASGRHEWSVALETSQRALALWRGPMLADVPSELLHLDVVPVVEELRWQAHDVHAAAQLQLGRYEELIRDHRTLSAAHPLRESVSARLMQALAESGRRDEALEVYRAQRERLIDELGIEPGQQLASLHQQVLNGTVAPHATTGASGPVQLPADVADFVGRETELESGRSALAGGQTLIVTGAAGLGKTALAVRLAYDVLDSYPDGALYADLREESLGSVEHIVTGFLRALDASAVVPDTIAAKTAMFRAMVRQKRVLVLLDNVESASQIDRLIPAGPGSACIMTTRRTLAEVAGARRLTLDPLSSEDCVRMFSRVIGDDTIADSAQVREVIVPACGGMPIAIRIVASRLAVGSKATVQRIADRIADPARRLDVLQVGDLRIRNVFAAGYESLGQPRDGELDRRLAFRTLALANIQELDPMAAAAMLDCPVPRVEAIVDELAEARMIDIAPDQAVVYHDLLRAYALDLPASADERHFGVEAVERLVRWYAVAALRAGRAIDRRVAEGVEIAGATGAELPMFTSVEDAVAWMDRHYPSVCIAMQQAIDHRLDDVSWTFPVALWGYFSYRRLLEDWASMLRLGLTSAERCEDLSAQARIHNNLATSLQDLGELDEAADHFRNALDLRTALGDVAGQAAVRMNLAYLEFSTDQFDSACTGFENAVGLWRQCDNPLGLASALLGLTEAAIQNGLDGPAEKSALEAAQICERERFDFGHADALSCLALVHLHRSDFDQALRLSRQSVEIRPAPVHGTAVATLRMAQALFGLGQLSEAHDSAQSARALFEALGNESYFVGRADDLIAECEAAGALPHPRG